MKSHVKILLLVAALVLLVQSANWVQAQPSSQGPQPPSVDVGLLGQLKRTTSGPVSIYYHQRTGKVSFIGATQAQPITVKVGLAGTVTPELAARSFLQGYGALFGLKDQTSEASVMRQAAVAGGRNKVRFLQRFKGIPVLAGELNINLDRNHNILSANGEIAPDLAVNVTPSVTAGTAQVTARAAVAQTNKLPADQFEAGKPTLWIYSPQLVDQPGAAALVWRMDVGGRTRSDIRETVLIDAHGGKVVFRWSLAVSALNRNTYTAKGGGTLPGTLCKTESGNTSDPCATDADVTNAHNLAGTTYNYYRNTFGRDSIDGAGLTLVSTAHYCPNTPTPCVWRNAQWDGVQMEYGDGFAAGDDVVGHELTHGVTQYESGLIYNGESGAINESLSDVFGESMDLTDGTGTDTAAVRWQIGEDTPGGAFRSMSDPPTFRDPDHMGSEYYYLGTADNGGVHTDSGVSNKAAFLIADGQQFNNVTVTGIGIDKMSRVYYEAQTNLLTSGSNYLDLGSSLLQACANLQGAYITASDCTQVRNAVVATEMTRVYFLSTSGNDANACNRATAPCRTFLQALTKAGEGGVVHILGGNYNEPMTLNKRVTIVGSGIVGRP